jgi:Rad3-related DNA helicase
MKKEEKKKHRLDITVDLRKGLAYHPVVHMEQVFFPFKPYTQQIEIVDVIRNAIKNRQNALIESPTGTGKTICLLVGALSSLVQSESKKKIFYLTRTHSQISQVVS